MQISRATTFGLHISKLAPHKMLVFSLLMSSSSLLLSSLSTTRDEQCRQSQQDRAKIARIAATQGAMDDLSRDIMATQKQVHDLVKAGKWTAQDDANLSALLKCYEARLELLKQP